MNKFSAWQSEELILMLKPTTACNFSCKYCFQNHKYSKRMTYEKWHTIKSLLSDPKFKYSPLKHVTLYFHGGEPLLAGKDFFRKVIYSFNDIPYSREIIIISNLSLLNDELAKIFIEENVLICTSLDGPRWLNDKCRIGPKGSSAFDATMKGINILRDEGGDPAGINCTLTKHHFGREEEIYAFFKELNIPLQINQVLTLDSLYKKINGLMDWYSDAKSFGHSLVKLFEIWLSDPACSLDVINFRATVDQLLNPKAEKYECATYQTLCFNPDGFVYPCPTFSEIKEANLGSYDGTQKSLEKILKNREELLINAWRAKRDKKCYSCKYSELCEGGCTLYGLKNHQKELCHDMECTTKKIFFEKVESHLNNILSEQS